MASLGLRKAWVCVYIVKDSPQQQRLFRIWEGCLKGVGFLGYSKSVGKKLLEYYQIFGNNLMIELRPSAEPIASYDEEKADNHVDPPLLQIEAPLRMSLLDPLVNLLHDCNLIVDWVDFFEAVAMDEDRGAPDEGYLLVDFEFNHVFLML